MSSNRPPPPNSPYRDCPLHFRDRRGRPRRLRNRRSREKPAGGRGLDQRPDHPDRAGGAAPARTRRAGLVLPGNVAAFTTGSLFARASGYVPPGARTSAPMWSKTRSWRRFPRPISTSSSKRRRAQLVQLQAAVQQAQANADLGKVTDQRTLQLVLQGWPSKQQGDTDRLTAASRRPRSPSPRPMS